MTSSAGGCATAGCRTRRPSPTTCARCRKSSPDCARRLRCRRANAGPRPCRRRSTAVSPWPRSPGPRSPSRRSGRRAPRPTPSSVTAALDLGSTWPAWAAAILGWDFIYYWNHRLSHESRWLWAVHVAHHSSERYNLSTALRQPVAESITVAVPYSLLALLGVRPAMIEQARALNLIYQFWIHTEAIRSIGPLERVLNTPSHHRVHHGSNRQYLDRNHGSILIVWDRLFGTFEPEDEPVVYGLTRNIDSYNPCGHRDPRARRHRPRRRPRRYVARPPLVPPARSRLGLRAASGVHTGASRHRVAPAQRNVMTRTPTSANAGEGLLVGLQ